MAANTEFFEALSALAAEKGVSKDSLVEKIQAAIVHAVRRDYGGADNIHVDIDPENEVFKIYIRKTVVEEGLLRFSGDESLPPGVLEVRRGARIDFGGRTIAVGRIAGDGEIAGCVLLNAAGKKRRVVLESLENDPTFEGGSE